MAVVAVGAVFVVAVDVGVVVVDFGLRQQQSDSSSWHNQSPLNLAHRATNL